jgi:outer membrane biosynthesis protein TonB
MDNLNVLVEAKKEYLGQLCLIMVPAMIETFENLYNESVSMSKGKKVLIQFQKLLKDVPNWSDTMSKQHADNITNRCAWFGDLLAAVFVACTKILSSVRLKSDGQRISLKLPTNEVFIQTCYNTCAKDLYKDPYVYHEEQSEYVRDETLRTRFTQCIEVSVKELIPVQQILQTYMTNTDPEKNIDLSDPTDTEDPEVYDEEPVPVMEEQPEEEVQAPEAPEAPEMEEGPTGLENEFKTIPNVPAEDELPQPQPQPQPQEQPQEEDDGVLFGDAPDRRR